MSAIAISPLAVTYERQPEHTRSSKIDFICSKSAELAKYFASPAVKQCMLDIIARNIGNAIDINRSLVRTNRRYRPYVSRMAYEWDLENFEQRMQTSGTYITSLRLHHPKTLVITKMLTDLDNLEKYLKQIVMAKDVATVLPELNGCVRLLNIRADLEMRYKLNLGMNHALKYATDNFDEDVKLAEQEADEEVVNAMEHFTIDGLIMDPLLYRYERGVQIEHHNILEHTYKRAKHGARDNIMLQEKTAKTGTQVSKCIFNYYKEEIDRLRSKIGYWRYHYEEEYSKYEDKAIVLDMRIKVMENRFNDYKERLVMYRSDIEELKRDNVLPVKRTKKHKRSFKRVKSGASTKP